MTNPYRAMCAHLTAALRDWRCETLEDRYADLIARARTLLAQPEPEGVTDCITYRELNDLCKEHFPIDQDDIDRLHGLVESAIAADRARRPKPPSLKEQALNTLDEMSKCMGAGFIPKRSDLDIIRRALEALDD